MLLEQRRYESLCRVFAIKKTDADCWWSWRVFPKLPENGLWRRPTFEEAQQRKEAFQNQIKWRDDEEMPSYV